MVIYIARGKYSTSERRMAGGKSSDRTVLTGLQQIRIRNPSAPYFQEG